MEAESFNYEEYCVYELIREKEKGIEIHGQCLNNKSTVRFDLCAPNGLPTLNMLGATVIEVKKHLSFSTIQRIEVQAESNWKEYNVLVVYFESTVSNIPFRVSNPNGKIVMYLSYKELKKKYNKKSEKDKEDFYAGLYKNTDWRQHRSEIIKDAQAAIKQDNNALFLGAGVSMSAKMPSWEELLKRLMGEVKTLKEPTLNAFKELSSHVFQECGSSYPIMGRYLQTAIGLQNNSPAFSALIQKSLYNTYNTSPLLRVLAHIVQQKKVDEIITYNYDNLLEQNLVTLKLVDSEDYTSIAKDAEIQGHNILPIYHVHGIIPREGPVDIVVFTEEEYHNRYYEAFHWSNVEQLHALSRKHCFFVGLSMNDPNLRRLLDTAQKMNKTNGDCHFVFLQRTKLESYCISNLDNACKFVHVSESMIDKKKQKEIYDLNYGVIESMFRELGLKVIWYEDHEKELPELVTEVFGLSKYSDQKFEDLLSNCESIIGELKQIEENMPTFNVADSSLKDIGSYIEYKKEYGEKYGDSIREVSDILTELTNRIDYDRLVDNLSTDELLYMIKSAPKYSENISNYSSFYHVWLESVKHFYK